ncbi:MAG: nucleoside triphosphate pyrophosphohydrolase [Bacteroidales bacterium]|nr:nucleoside triphosphate pyrophosphohydrolase [Bacteroidales bacterium]
MLNKEKKLEAFERALEVMDRLRADCPWNHAQTIDTLRPMTIEEVYELSDAVLKKDDKALEKELGDVFLHVIFYAKIAEEEGRYDIADVLGKLCEKMIYRHPHVFSTTKVADADEVSTNWEMLKAKEKGGNKRILSGIPDSLPPILKAYSMQDKARGVGFDWEEKSQVWDKVKEEQAELQAEFEAMSKAVTDEEKKAANDRAEEELGDFMFATVNAARLYGIDPDTALNKACDKFRRRFTYLEENTIRQGRDLHDMTLQEMDAIWDEGKAKGL